MKKICFLNNGCGSHTETFRQIFKSVEQAYTLTNLPHKADIIIDYFCAVTQYDCVKTIPAELLYLSKLKKEGAILIICGCAVDVVGKDFFLSLDFVDYAIGSQNFLQEILDILNFKCSGHYYIEDADFRLSIDICIGCAKKNGWCSFCKQHYLRKPVKSMPIDEVCKLAAEITSTTSVFVISLSSLNICNYGIDFGDRKPKLHLLIQALTKIPTVKFIELYSLTASCMYEELIEEIATNDKVILVELAMQSGSDAVLNAMNTGATVNELQVLLDRFSHKPMRSIFVTSHPYETMEDVQKTIDFIEKNNLWYPIVTSCKSSEGTPCYAMEQLDEEAYNNHYNLIGEAVMKLRDNFLNSLIGTFVYGYLFMLTRYEEYDMADIRLQARDFRGQIIVRIKNYSSSPYNSILDSVEEGNLAKARVTSIRSNNSSSIALLAEDLEVL